MKRFEINGEQYTEFETREDITPDLIEALEHAVEWQDDRPRVAWGEVWDRMERHRLPDGSKVALPSDTDASVFTALKRHGRAFRDQLS